MSPKGLVKVVDHRSHIQKEYFLSRGLAVTLLALSLVSCRSKISAGGSDVSNKRTFDKEAAVETPMVVPDPEAEVPKDVSLGMTAPRFVVQTRSVLRLQLGADVLAGGESFTLLSKATPLTKSEALNVSAAGRDGYDYLVTADGHATLSLFPSSSKMSAKLPYGDSNLTLNVDNGAGPEVGAVRVTLHDFYVPAMPVTARFVEARQTVGGFQGGYGAWGGKTTASDGSVMISGAFHAINH